MLHPSNPLDALHHHYINQEYNESLKLTLGDSASFPQRFAPGKYKVEAWAVSYARGVFNGDTCNPLHKDIRRLAFQLRITVLRPDRFL